MLRILTVTTLISFAALVNPVFAQYPLDLSDQKDQEIPDISLGGIDWSGLEVEYQSDEVERKPWHNKIDGRARIQQRKLEILHRETAGFDSMERLDAEIPVRMDVIIHVSHSNAASKLKELGFRISRDYSDILTGSIPFEKLQDAAVLDEVSYIETAPEFESHHDVSIPEVRADLVHEGSGLNMPYRGEDVVVGVVDSGIDFTHPDFNTDDGTRIQYLVELLSDDDERTGNCPSDFDIESGDGNCIEWTAQDIDDDPDGVTQIDGQAGGSHGTHVTGSAAGGGRADSDMAGVAPDSDIIMVNASRAPEGSRSYAFNDILNATHYIFNRADEMGKPAVVNLSLGAFAGPRDGSTGVEEILNILTDNGQLIVSSSGNSGFEPSHTGGDMAPRSRYIAPVVVRELPNQPPSSSLELEAWYETGTVSEFKIIGLQRDNDQAEILGQTPWLRPGDEMDDEIEITDGGDTKGFLIADASVTNADINNDSQFTAEIFTETLDTDLTDTQWVVVVNSSIKGGRFDMWVNSGGFVHPRSFNVGNVEQLTGSNRRSVTIPASASDVLSVGGYVGRDSFTLPDEDCPINLPDGVDCTLTLPVPTNPLDRDQDRNPRFGELAFFSSKGPLRTGESAIDITAPAFLVYSTLSGDFDPPQEALIRPGGDYFLNNGTSMAAPHVSGAIALMLESEPSLSVSDVRSIFAATGREDNFTGALPNNEFGYGKLDVLAAMQYLEDDPAKLADTSTEQPEQIELSNYPNPFNPVTTVSFALPESKEVSVEVFNSLGQQVKTLTAGEEYDAGTHEFSFDGSNLSSGVYLIRMQAGDQQLTRPAMLVK